MTKKDKETRGRVIQVSKADRRAFKQYLLILEDLEVTKSPDEIADEIFSYGLREMIKSMASEK